MNKTVRTFLRIASVLVLIAIGFCIASIWSLNQIFSSQCQSMSILFFVLAAVSAITAGVNHDNF